MSKGKGKGGSLLDMNGDKKVGLGDAVTLFVSGVIGLLAVYLCGVFGFIESPDLVSSFVALVIAFLAVGIGKNAGIVN